MTPDMFALEGLAILAILPWEVDSHTENLRRTVDTVATMYCEIGMAD